MRKVHPFMLRGIWVLAVFWGFLVSSVWFCARWGFLVGPFPSGCVQGLRFLWVCPFSVSFFGRSHVLGYYLHDLGGDNWAAHNTVCLFWGWVRFVLELYMLALVGLPSLRGYYACMVFSAKGAFWRNCRLTERETSFSLLGVFLYSRYSLRRWWGKVLWLLWVGRARHPGPFSGSMSVEVFNIGGWLTHGDLALETTVDFLAVIEHRLVPARVRGEWARLRARGASSVWSPASQESSHVGHGGVGVV